MQIYSYVLKTESGDLCHKILINKNYDNAIDFMKDEQYELNKVWWDKFNASAAEILDR